jgi:hypothetical protein
MTDNRLDDYLNHIRQAANDACSFIEGMNMNPLNVTRSHS